MDQAVWVQAEDEIHGQLRGGLSLWSFSKSLSLCQGYNEKVHVGA